MNDQLNNQSYDSFKQKALNSPIIRKTVMVRDIELLTKESISYAGVEFKITEQAFKSLLKILRISNTQMGLFNEILGEQITAKIIKALQQAIALEKKDSQITMIVNKLTHKVVDFSKSAEGILSNNAYFELFEQTMNNHSGMVIKNMSVSEYGNIEISVLNNNWEFNVGNAAGLKDEYFKSGLVFINTPSATIINPFNERLICTNGMVTTTKGLSMILKNANAGEVSAFFDHVTNLKGLGTFEEKFKGQIITMMDTQASYSELERVRQAIEWEVDMNDPSNRETVEMFIPVMEMKRAYLDHNIDLNMLEEKKKKAIRSMYTVWELVNKLTDLSSHPLRYGLSLKNGNSSIFNLQKVAGELAFKENYDLTSVVQLF